ncbi:FtsX-like permease family protein [Parapedobacter indicus]|uniref:Lipoprotein-releasing system permease protein n=1 Tax=Parapedobacter indicus TaxID=1477437 RepID=A0A1I3K7M2_9SPHI|nr:FtsX-like permease family protein [Parapedobacter indicus]PPL01737.1 lipoprotein-releasing system permease protein [Parapedobacter indicus]SFI68503.1 lipoprotein-releasing system permease protein [Parapedobacter indicus]
MNIALYFAKRYLRSKKTINAVNIISGISVVGVLVSSASLIVILSFYNGLENLIFSMYSSFTPELRIEPREGKGFAVDSVLADRLKKFPEVRAYREVLQERVLLRYGDAQYIATLKGTTADHALQSMDTLLQDGRFILHQGNIDYAVMGARVQGTLGISLQDESRRIEVFSPRKGVKPGINPAEEFTMRTIRPVGVLEYQQEFDDLLIVPLSFAREVLGEFSQVSAIEINLLPGSNTTAVQKQLAQQVGSGFVVKNREQQNPTLYKIVRTEKWAVFIIIAFTGIIAIFNIVGSLTMLVIDKKKDISVLMGLGAGNDLIRRIFFVEGLLISLTGCVAGLVLGFLFCLSQQTFGWIRFGEAENLVTDTYPVDIRATDFLLVFLTVFVVSALISLVSSRLSVKQTVRLS